MSNAMATLVEEPGWLARVEAMAQRGRAITEEMNRPEVATNGAMMVRLSRELGALEKILRPYRDYRAVTAQLAETHLILDDPASDADLRALAEAELPVLAQRRAQLLQALMEQLVTGDDAAISSIIVEIRAGTGGEEAALFARELMDMYSAYAAKRGFKCEVLSLSPSDLGGVREAVLNVTGDEVYLAFRFEAGGHRVQRVPETEAQGRIHTSAATVAVLPEPDELNLEINWERDVEESVSRAGGPGGQNVNKVASAIRLVHQATGITVSMRDERSQHKNRERARRILLSRVYDHYQTQQQAKIDAERKSMVGSGDRNDRIRTYNFPQNRCTDHRINEDIFDLAGVLQAGRIGEFLPKLHARDLQRRLDSL